jgi:hypothetical protein
MDHSNARAGYSSVESMRKMKATLSTAPAFPTLIVQFLELLKCTSRKCFLQFPLRMDAMPDAYATASRKKRRDPFLTKCMCSHCLVPRFEEGPWKLGCSDPHYLDIIFVNGFIFLVFHKRLMELSSFITFFRTWSHNHNQQC